MPKHKKNAEREAPVPAEEVPATRPDVPPVTVSCDVVGRVRIPRTAMSLLLGVGELADETAVLMPTVELKIDIVDDTTDETETLVHCISLDNASFLVTSLALNLRDTCAYLKKVSAGSIRPEPDRMHQVKYYLSTAQDFLAECVDEVEQAIDAIDTAG